MLEEKKLENLYFLALLVDDSEIKPGISREEWVIGYYRNQGYECEKITHEVMSRLGLSDIIWCGTFGCPDLIVYRRLFDQLVFFLVEVKHRGDGLNRVQCEWVSAHPDLKVVLVFVSRCRNGEPTYGF